MHKFDGATGEKEGFSGIDFCEERLFDGPEGGASEVLDGEAGITGDGADGHAVLSSDAIAADEPESFEFAEAMVIRVGSQRFTSAGGEIEGPVPFLAGELVVGGGCADFCEEVSGVEPGAGGDCDEVLAEDIDGGVVGLASFELSGGDGIAGGGSFDQFKGVCGHAGDSTDGAGSMSAASGALQESGDSARRADLQDSVDRTEIDSQIETAGADDGSQLSSAESIFDPVAGGGIERPVVQSDQSGPVRPCLQHGVVPGFGLRAGVCEDQRGCGLVNGCQNIGKLIEAHVAGPGEAFDAFGDE